MPMHKKICIWPHLWTWDKFGSCRELVKRGQDNWASPANKTLCTFLSICQQILLSRTLTKVRVCSSREQFPNMLAATSNTFVFVDFVCARICFTPPSYPEQNYKIKDEVQIVDYFYLIAQLIAQFNACI